MALVHGHPCHVSTERCSFVKHVRVHFGSFGPLFTPQGAQCMAARHGRLAKLLLVNTSLIIFAKEVMRLCLFYCEQNNSKKSSELILMKFSGNEDNCQATDDEFGELHSKYKTFDLPRITGHERLRSFDHKATLYVT